MKKFLFFLIVAIIFLSPIMGDNIQVFIGNGYNYNDILKSMINTQYLIGYDTEKDEYYFFVDQSLTKGFIYFQKEDLLRIRSALQKYLAWEKIAIEKEIKITKKIPDSIITGKLCFSYGDDWYFEDKITLTFTFFSQNANRHQLVMESSKIKSSENKYINFKVDDIYLDHDHVAAFIEGISDDSIKKAISDKKKEKESAKLFQ